MKPISIILGLIPWVQVVLCAPQVADSIASATQTEYLVLSANINSGFAADHTVHNETFSVAVKGVNPGALPVNCTVEWDAFRANGKSVTIPLKCSDTNVLASLTRENVIDYYGWDVTVRLNGFDAAVWRQLRIATSPGWNCTINKAYCAFDGGAGQLIQGIPAQSLHEVLTACLGSLDC